MNSIQQISIFKNYFNPAVIGDMLLTDFVYEVIEGTFKAEIEEIRAANELTPMYY